MMSTKRINNKISSFKIKTEADTWGVWQGKGGGLTHPLFCQIIIKSAPDWLDYIQTKILEGGVNHPRHPHIMDSLLHLNTQYDIFKNSCYLAFFLI